MRASASGLTSECAELAVSHVDLMFHILCRLGFGVSLDAAAKGMNLAPKTMNGGLKTQMQSRFEKRASKTGIGKNIAGTYLRGKVLQTTPWEWSPSDGTSSYSGRA